MIQHKHSHKGRPLVQQSQVNTTYQQRIKQYLQKHSSTDTNLPQSKKYIPTKIQLEQNKEVMLAFKRRFKRRPTQTPPTLKNPFQQNI